MAELSNIDNIMRGFQRETIENIIKFLKDVPEGSVVAKTRASSIEALEELLWSLNQNLKENKP